MRGGPGYLGFVIDSHLILLTMLPPLTNWISARTVSFSLAVDYVYIPKEDIADAVDARFVTDLQGIAPLSVPKNTVLNYYIPDRFFPTWMVVGKAFNGDTVVLCANKAAIDDYRAAAY